MSLNKDMGDAHEDAIADLLGGRQSRGSGNQWQNPIDGRQSRRHRLYAFAWDCKSTLAKSMSVSLAMWDKAREQAGGERPMIPIRFYADEKLRVTRDLIVVDANDFAEVLEAAEGMSVAQVIEAMEAEFKAADFALVTPHSVLTFLRGLVG